MTTESKPRKADSQIVLEAMAEAYQNLGPRSCMALAKRLGWTHTRVHYALKKLSADELVAYDPFGLERDWELTELGWQRLSAPRPIWMEAAS